MADEELTGQGGGVGEPQPGTGAGVEVSGAVEGQAQPTAETSPATAKEPTGPATAERRVDLTELDDFRKWQAVRDRREAQLQQQLEASQQQIEGLQRQMDEARLANADPEEVAAYYQQQVQQLQEGQRRQAQAAQERDQIIGHVYSKLEEMGLKADTPGLEWPEEISWRGAADVLASAAKIKAVQAQVAASETRATVDQATQAAKAEALNAAGVTKVSTSPGQAASKDLRAEFEAEKAKLRHSGDVGAYARLKSKYRKLGLDV